jgi:hypothetical protein
MMTKRRRLFVAVALVAFPLPGYLVGHAETKPETRAASMLFKQFETVAYARTDFLSRFDAYDVNKDVDSLANLRLPFLELVGGLRFLGSNAERDVEKSYSAVLVGAKDFVGPEGLGAVSSRKCYLGMLEGSAQPDIEPDFRQASYESIDGRQVWTWSIPAYEGHPRPTKFYAVQIASSYFVMTNNREDFREAVNALASAESSQTTSIGVSGWESLSAHKYWVYRLIRRSGVVSSEAAGIEDLTPDMISLAFFADIDKRTGSLRILSSDKSTKAIPKVFRASELNHFQSLEPGIWQETISLSKDEAGFDALFEVFYSFGFGVAL